jgi:predicted acyl esterase
MKIKFLIIFIISIISFLSPAINAQNKKGNESYNSNLNGYILPDLPKPPFSSGKIYNVIRQDFNLTLRDNIILDCSKFYPSEPNPILTNGYPGVILCHGFGQTKETLVDYANNQASWGYCVYIYSMRGQGASGGFTNLISLTEALDLIEMANYVKHDYSSSGVDSSKVLVMGGSQGGIVPYMAACNGMNIRTIISALSSPEFASSWIENGSVKMTFLWALSYGDSVRYTNTLQSMKNWVYSAERDKWDSISFYFPQNRNFVGSLGNLSIPLTLENSWQDKFFNASGNINTIPLISTFKRYYFGAVPGNGGDSSSTENIWHMNFINEWMYYWLYDINNNILTRPQYHYASTTFPVLSNRWSFIHDSSFVWPPSGLNDLKYYFNENGKLKITPNPNNNANVTLFNTVSSSLTMQQAVNWGFTGFPFDTLFHKDQLIFETDPLEQYLRVIGTPSMNVDYLSDANVFQFDFQIYEVSSIKTKMVARINYTDRNNTPGIRKTANLNGISFSHLFQKNDKIRIVITNLDNSSDDFLTLGTNPHVLPVLTSSTNKLFLSSNSYISFPSMYLSSGIHSNNENINEQYTLYQNYPNPFNPVTVIKFSIPKNGLVTLKIYDIAGKEITTLVNSQKSAGTYSYYFNAADFNLSSGVYFYKLSTPEFKKVNKMVLIK